jgi:hypothetical protein
MSLKAMVFIDGGWLYRARSTIFSKLGEETFEIDYAKLPRLLCEDVANTLDEDVSLVRTLYCGTVPSYRSGFNTSKQHAFYDFLEKSCRYDVDIHEVDVGGDSVRSDENWIHMSLGAAMLYYAAQASAYDVAILVGDATDYAPVMRRVRLFGKRVQIVSLHTLEGTPPTHGESLIWKVRVSDFDPIFLDDHAMDLKLIREYRTRVCKQCGNEEETTWAGVDFFCSRCRGRYRND